MSHWVNQSVFYHIYPLGFCGAPEYNPGGAPVPRLDKLKDWIPHLKELGVNALYLGPVFQSVKHGYDTTDYLQIDCRLGDNGSFAALCGQLHESGICVVLDGVFNHGEAQPAPPRRGAPPAGRGWDVDGQIPH